MFENAPTEHKTALNTLTGNKSLELLHKNSIKNTKLKTRNSLSFNFMCSIHSFHGIAIAKRCVPQY